VIFPFPSPAKKKMSLRFSSPFFSPAHFPSSQHVSANYHFLVLSGRVAYNLALRSGPFPPPFLPDAAFQRPRRHLFSDRRHQNRRARPPPFFSSPSANVPRCRTCSMSSPSRPSPFLSRWTVLHLYNSSFPSRADGALISSFPLFPRVSKGDWTFSPFRSSAHRVSSYHPFPSTAKNHRRRPLLLSPFFFSGRLPHSAFMANDDEKLGPVSPFFFWLSYDYWTDKVARSAAFLLARFSSLQRLRGHHSGLRPFVPSPRPATEELLSS